jgi:hypothetical protein
MFCGARNDRKPLFHTLNTHFIIFLDVLSVLSVLSILSVLLVLPDKFCGRLICSVVPEMTGNLYFIPKIPISSCFWMFCLLWLFFWCCQICSVVALCVLWFQKWQETFISYPKYPFHHVFGCSVCSVCSVCSFCAARYVLWSPHIFCGARYDRKPLFYSKITHFIMFLDVLSVLSVLSVLPIRLFWKQLREKYYD